MVAGNREVLQGKLRVTHTKTYTKDDKTRSGTSKEGWRLFVMKGDFRFLKAIEHTTDDHLFRFASSWVQLRGGKRKPPAAVPPPTNRSWFSDRSRQQQRFNPFQAERRRLEERERRARDCLLYTSDAATTPYV